MIRKCRKRRECFHHDWKTGESWIRSILINLGHRKLFECSKCGKVWIV